MRDKQRNTNTSRSRSQFSGTSSFPRQIDRSVRADECPSQNNSEAVVLATALPTELTVGCLGDLYFHYYGYGLSNDIQALSRPAAAGRKRGEKHLEWTTSEDAAMVRASVEVTMMKEKDGQVKKESPLELTTSEDAAMVRSSVEVTMMNVDDDIKLTSSESKSVMTSDSTAASSIDSQPNIQVQGGNSLPQRYALSVATNPKRHLFITLVVCALLTVVAFMIVAMSGLKIDFVKFGIWLTRDTLVSNRVIQQLIHLSNSTFLFGRVPRVEFIINGESVDMNDPPSSEVVCSGQWYGSPFMTSDRQLNFNTIWTTKGDSQSALDSTALYEMCLNEEHVLQVLEENDLCYKCPVDDDAQGQESCIRPYSLVAAARLYLQTISTLSMDLTPSIYLTPSLSCEDLQTAWTEDVQASFSDVLVECANALLEKYKLKDAGDGHSTQCLLPDAKMVASLVDVEFPSTGNVKHSSAVYATKHDSESLDQMYQLDKSNSFAQDCSALTGLYEVGFQSFFTHEDGGFLLREVNQKLIFDSALSAVALVLSGLLILWHTKSPFLTLLGLLQISLALPITWLLYTFVFGLKECFPIINANAVFIVFSLGADGVFVTVDKWKNTRSIMTRESTTDVAVISLPSAALATFITSFTTSVGFFSSMVSNVLAIKVFGIFTGTLVAVDYILSVLILSPTLCLYDEMVMKGSQSWLVSLQKSKQEDKHQRNEKRETTANTNEKRLNRLFGMYCDFLYTFRWASLLVSISAIAACSVVASSFKPPTNEPVPNLFPVTQRYQAHGIGACKLMAIPISLATNPKWLVQMVFGVQAIDNGDRYNPNDPGTIAYDNDFDPANNQLYLLDMCDKIEKPDEDYICSLKEFDTWLKEQSNSSSPDGEYVNSCDGETSLPVTVDMFDQCFIAFSQLTNNSEVTYVENKVKTVVINTRVKSTILSPPSEMVKDLRNVEDWSVAERSNAPNGANNFFFSSFVFWFSDTFNDMSSSAVKAALIMICIASIVILLCTRSVTLMLFSDISILYVLVAATASLAGMGWTLGIIESILFATLVGIGSDFILHFAHAYSMLPGKVSKLSRTKHAILHMGPSILGSAATTLSTAFVMIFCRIVLIKKFAIMLIMTMVHALIGSFFVFLLLCLCFGPSEPNKMFDSIEKKIVDRIKKRRGTENYDSECFTIKNEDNKLPKNHINGSKYVVQHKRWMAPICYVVTVVVIFIISFGAASFMKTSNSPEVVEVNASVDFGCNGRSSDGENCQWTTGKCLSPLMELQDETMWEFAAAVNTTTLNEYLTHCKEVYLLLVSDFLSNNLNSETNDFNETSIDSNCDDCQWTTEKCLSELTQVTFWEADTESTFQLLFTHCKKVYLSLMNSFVRKVI